VDPVHIAWARAAGEDAGGLEGLVETGESRLLLRRRGGGKREQRGCRQHRRETHMHWGTLAGKGDGPWDDEFLCGSSGRRQWIRAAVDGMGATTRRHRGAPTAPAICSSVNSGLWRPAMTTAEHRAPASVSSRKPDDQEIDVYGLTHPGKVRQTNEDHFLICSLRKQMNVHLTSLPDTAAVISGGERLAFLAMVADGVGGGAMGEEASRLALEAIMEYVNHPTACFYAADTKDDEVFANALREAAMVS